MTQNCKIVERLGMMCICHPSEPPQDCAACQAASLIQELGEALEPFADIADQVLFDRASDKGCWAAPVSAIRRANAIVSKLKEA